MNTLVPLLAALLLPQAPNRAPEPAAVAVFVPDDDVVAYREPALARTPGGTLIAVAEARRDDASEAPWQVDLALRTSTDLGRTWSEARMVREFSSDEAATRPSLIVQPETGRVFLLYNHAPFGVDWDSSAAGTNVAGDARTLHVHLMYSDDEGATWSEPVDLNPMVKLPEWEAISVSSGSGLATSAGRLIQPVFVRGSAGGIGARNITSEDGGVSWSPGPLAGEETHESCVIELADGSLLQNMTPVPLAFPREHPKRKPDAIKWRLVARSRDGHSFAAPTPDRTLVDSNFDAALVRRPAVESDPRDLIVFANPDTPTGRQRLSLRWSEDGCETWVGKYLVDPGPSGASSLSFLADDSLGVLFERGEERFDEQIAFQRVSLEHLTSGVNLLGADGSPRAEHPQLWAWYDFHGAETTGGEGSQELGLADRSTAERHDLDAVSLGQGSVLARSLNRRDVARFLGPLTAPGGTPPPAELAAELAGPLTISFVARVGGVRETNYVLDGRGERRIALRTRPGATKGERAHWELRLKAGDQEVVLPSSEVIARDFAVHTILLRRKTAHHFIDGRLAGTVELPESELGFGLDGLILGTDGEATSKASCDIAELLVLGTALTTAERKALEGYLKQKFRL